MVRIKSLVSSGPLWIKLTTGESLRLAPGAVSPERPDVVVANNDAIDSMARRGLIEIVSGSGASGPSRPRKTKASSKDATES
jgi:hypothetical protein